MKIAIMGGTGFIGKHLCEAVNRYSKNAISISRSPDMSFLKKYAPEVKGISIYNECVWEEIKSADVLIYLGSNSKPSSDWRSPSTEITENVGEFAGFVRKLFDCNPSCHLIYASSGGSVYGQTYSQPVDEQYHISPANSYALGKVLCEDILKFYNRIEGYRITILRISNPVGRWQLGGRHGMVSSAIDACLQNKELYIYGDGLNMRDYFDADELAELFINISEHPGKGLNVYNVGSGVGFTEKDVIDLVKISVKNDIKYEFRPARPYDVRYSVLNSQKLYIDYGWKTSLSLPDIIEKLYRSALNFGFGRYH